MTVQQIIFLLFSAVVVAAAVAVVTVRNLFHAALWLLLSFFGVGVIYVLLEAPFFAAAQLFIYMGAIGILIIFGIMMTRGMMRGLVPPANDQWWLAGLLAAALLLVLVVLARQVLWPATAGSVADDSLRQLGLALTDPQRYALPFEVASVLLVMALIGAVTIARER